MKTKKFFKLSMLAALAVTALQVNAASVDANAAKGVASTFLKHHVTAKNGMLNAPAMGDLSLVHAEPSAAVVGANDYYAFNIKGGGFIIVAGEDRAARVLGYSDKGSLDFNHLPYGLQGLLNGYKQEMEFLLSYTADDLVIVEPKLAATVGVEPLIKTTWGQELPYCLQCPMKNGEYCVVGCIATAMAQVMYYWQYPTSCSAMSSFYSSGYGNVPALPATTFDYSKMLPSYCHWDWDNSMLVQDVYTDEQAQEVAKLSRYCGQASKMAYSPNGSGAQVSSQLSAMKNFGYSSNAKDVSKDGWWSSYTTSQWESMMKTELDAGRPILYSADDPNDAGHAFICDGYNSNGYFHFNLGWYGTCDGWYLSTSLRMIHRDGSELNFSAYHEMLTGVEPPVYCIINPVQLDAATDLLVLGEDLSTSALDFTFRTSYNSFNLQFGLVDMNGERICLGNAVSINKNSFVQGSTVNGNITLPESLETGAYNLGLYYYTTSNTNPTLVTKGEGLLQVVGHVAKYNAPFTVSDVTEIVNRMTNDDNTSLTITDATMLINYILNQD